MDWKGGRESGNVEDRRGMSGGRTAVVGGGIGTLVLALVYMFLGGDPRVVLENAPQVAAPQGGGDPQQPYQETPAEAEQARFIKVTLGYTEDVWKAVFAERGAQYVEPKLVLFTQAVQSGCGAAESAMGPFYCPADQRVFLDLSFFDELSGRLGAQGEFARAYVVAHEIGHHVQNLIGVSDKVHERQQRASEAQANALSVRLELQADCFAGVWANRLQRTQHVLEAGDAESALSAASAVGDDRLQKAARGYVVPDSFTHGSSEQRMRWFRAGFEGGELEGCDTFGARQL